ncbi:hypothetical protein EYF80_009099 [Liparis tanakae]|uniref:Uncharacterized protein n=1 Tax=Liparis tanakae TaxID=230148 RepID=A0A4Z2ITR9_9TELE|nr:hypothetical protein EYF80_009099 [Liparis tanakae]
MMQETLRDSRQPARTHLDSGVPPKCPDDSYMGCSLQGGGVKVRERPDCIETTTLHSNTFRPDNVKRENVHRASSRPPRQRHMSSYVIDPRNNALLALRSRSLIAGGNHSDVCPRQLVAVATQPAESEEETAVQPATSCF